jgi:hypothetical protein
MTADSRILSRQQQIVANRIATRLRVWHQREQTKRLSLLVPQFDEVSCKK